MIGYRTVGNEELNMLLMSHNPIFGMRRWQNNIVCGCSEKIPYGIVCFFKEPIAISNKKHIIEVVVEIDDYTEGIGSYEVNKEFDKTKVITFRGKIDRKIPELYTRFYAPKQIKAVNLREYYGEWYTTELKKACEEYGIEFHNSKEYHFNCSL